MAFNFNKVQPVEQKPVEKKLEPVDELKQFINTFLDDGKFDEAEAEQILQKAAELNISEDEAIDLMEAALNQLKSQPAAASASSAESIYPDDLLDVIKEGEIRNIKSVFRTWQNAISSVKTDNDQYDLIQCLYYMTFAALNPDGIIAEQESRKAQLVSNYWRIYWTYIAYMKNDRKAFAEDMLGKLQSSSKYNEDNVTILETIAALNEAGPDAALKFFNSRKGAERYSNELLLLVKALRMEIGLVKPSQSTLNECAFVLDNLVWWEDEDTRAERKARQKLELQRMEREAKERIRQEQEAEDRKRLEQEIQERKRVERLAQEQLLMEKEANRERAAAGCEFVDLGLSVLWANCNLGAESPEKPGNHYAWGETEPKEKFSKKNYLYGRQNRERLDASHDPATKLLGSEIRVPTKRECDELIEKCKIVPSSVNGVQGYKVIGSNGKSIFLPAAGIFERGSFSKNRTTYWTADCLLDGFGEAIPYCLEDFHGNPLAINHWGEPENGRPIRPVKRK